MRASSSGPHDGTPARAFSSATSVSLRLNAAYRVGKEAICKVTITRPVAPAAVTMADGAPPPGTAKPRVNSADPAALKADPRPPASNGHNNSQNPTKEVASHAASWPIKIAAAWAASTRSRRR